MNIRMLLPMTVRCQAQCYAANKILLLHTCAFRFGSVRRRRLLDGNDVASECGATHVAHLVAIETARTMHRGAVVPYHQVEWPPGMRITTAPCRVFRQVAQEYAASGTVQPDRTTDRNSDFRPVTGCVRTRR